MSDEDEYDDELPPISVNSSTRDTGSLAMPSAEALASERAREEECERELRALRAEDDAAAAVAPLANAVRADSSGSEGEAALTAAVTALRVRPAARAPPSAPPAPAELLPALLARLPRPPDDCLDALRRVDDDTLAAIIDDVCSALESGRSLSESEAALAAGALCCGCLRAGAPGRRRRCRRLLHQLFDDLPTLMDQEAIEAVVSGIVAGVTDSGARLELADALAPVASPAAPASPAARLTAALLAAALADTAAVDPPDMKHAPECMCAWAASIPASTWRALEAGPAARAIRLAGRLLRACPRPAPRPDPSAPAPCAPHRARLLAALAAPPADARHAAPDRLEVLVSASKLQLLFRD